MATEEPTTAAALKSRLDRGIRIGVSGWSYPAWREGFYQGLAQKAWLGHCAAHFTAIEINASYYRLPRPSAVASWATQAPDDFRFAAKGHRIVTQAQRLAGAARPIARQRASMAGLGDKLAVVLWQCPRWLRKRADLLAEFADALGEWPEVRHAIEFRHESWFDDEVAALLGGARIANCLSDAGDWPLWDAVTTDLVYVRLHGRPKTYSSAYDEAALEDWARRVRDWRSQGREVHVYFDNTAAQAAPEDAQKLIALLAA